MICKTGNMNSKFNKIKSALAAMMLLLLMLFSTSCDTIIKDNNTANSPSGEFAVHYLDVGQGDSVFLELPNSECMLIDAGENYHCEGIISYIAELGYTKINYLVATHPHADHIGSMAYIVNNFDIGTIYMTKVSTNTKTYESLLNAIKNKGLKIKSATAGMNIIDVDNFKIDIIAPVKIYSDDLNNCSVVMKAVYGNTSFLFTGDAEKKELDTISDDMSADVLKVGHHGSKTSTTEEFLKEVSPSIAVISCGKDNSYGHPHDSTLQFLNEINCKIYRTDIDQTILITSNGEDIDVETNVKSIERAK